MPPRLDARLVDLSVETTSPAYLTDAAAFVPYVREPTKHLYVYRETDDGCGTTVEIDARDGLARSDWQVHGFALTGQYGLEAFDREVAVGVDRVLAETPLTEEDFPLSFFKVIAVDPAHRGKGIGSELGARAVSTLFEDPPVAVMAWLRDDPSNRKLVEQYAHSKVATFPEYFPAAWDCPECGFDADCTCTVEMYVWFGDERDQAVLDATHGQSRPDDETRPS